MYIRLQGI